MAKKKKLYKGGGKIKKPELIPNTPEYEYLMGGQIGSAIGTAGGAIAGSVIPGIGTTLGATAGGSLGSLVGTALDDSGEKDQQSEMQYTKPEIINSKMKGQKQSFYQSGGGIKPPQYEVEQGEVIDGGQPQAAGRGNMRPIAEETHVVEGATHENGGVQGSGGERVFSDHLKIPGTDKTFAEAAKKVVSKSGQGSLQKKQKDRPYDKFIQQSSDRTEKRNEAQKDALFEIQEGMKGEQSRKPVMKKGGKVVKYRGGDKLPKYQNGVSLSAPTLPNNYEVDTPSDYTSYDNPYDMAVSEGNITPAGSSSDGRSAKGGDRSSPFGQYLDQQLLEQSEAAGPAQTAAQISQAVPYAYDMFTAGDKDYIPQQENKRAQESLNQLRGLPTEYDIRPQLNQISDSYGAMTDQVGRYSVSPQVTRANIRQGYADRLKAEDQAFGQKINRENQLESQKRRALASQEFRTGTQAAKFRDQKNIRDAKVDARSEMRRKQALSGMSEVARGAAMDKLRRLRDTERMNLLHDLYGNTGVMSRMSSDAGYLKSVKQNNPD